MPLDLGGAPKAVRLRTEPTPVQIYDEPPCDMGMRLNGVSSTSADEATGDSWNEYSGLKDDQLPEVPPDGEIELSFYCAALLKDFRAALKLLPCCHTRAASSRKLILTHCPSERVIKDNETVDCVRARISPPLPVNEGALLRLPKGARLPGHIAPPSEHQDVYVFGLRRFRLPFDNEFVQFANATDDSGGDVVRYRQLSLWLPHGLAAGTPPSALRPFISICSYADPYRWSSRCVDLDRAAWKFSRPERGRLLLYVPQLLPNRHYHMRVASTRAVRDAYGLPLQASDVYFFTAKTGTTFQGPQLSSGTSTAIVEAPMIGVKPSPLLWPFVSLGLFDPTPPAIVHDPEYHDDIENTTFATFWPIKSPDDFTSAQGSSRYDRLPKAASKAPLKRVSNKDGALTLAHLDLGTAPATHLVGTCCTWRYDYELGEYHPYLTDHVTVIASDLQVVIVRGTPLTWLWVTSTQGVPAAVPQAKAVSVRWLVVVVVVCVWRASQQRKCVVFLDLVGFSRTRSTHTHTLPPRTHNNPQKNSLLTTRSARPTPTACARRAGTAGSQ